MSEKNLYNCYDIPEFKGHCLSCHEDHDDYDYDLCSPSRDGINFAACCNFGHWLEELSEEEWKRVKEELVK